jgi:hypothetical protein
MIEVKYPADLGSWANMESLTNSKWSKNRLNLSFCCGVLTRDKASSNERTPLKSINPWLFLGVGDLFRLLLGVGLPGVRALLGNPLDVRGLNIVLGVYADDIYIP